MIILATFKVNHTIDGQKKRGFVAVGLHSMAKDGNTYEYIKTYKLDKDCPVLSDGAIAEPLFNERGKVADWKVNG